MFTYLPTQDGPCHLENAFMLSHYSDADRTYQRYYEINSDPVPNWFSHLVLASLMTFVPPLIAEKILITVYIILFVCAIYYLLNAVDSSKTFYVLLAFPFIYNYPFHMGFYNFSISVPLLFIVIGYWWKRREILHWRTFLGLNLLLIFLYFCHIISLVIALMAIFILATLQHRLKFYKVLYLAFALIPSYLLPAHFIYSRGTEYSYFWPFDRLWYHFISIGSLTSYSRNEYYLGKMIAILFALLALYTLLPHLNMFTSRNKLDNKDKKPSVQFKADDGFFIVLIFCIALYFFMPNKMSEGAYLTARLNLYPFLMTLPWLNSDFRKPVIKYAIGVIFIALTLIHLAYTVYYYKVLNDGLNEYTSGIPFVKKNETILPLSFDHRGSSLRIGTYRHAVGYYCMEAGTIELYNYQGNKGYFPLNYKAEMNPFTIIENLEKIDPSNTNLLKYPELIDYILIWGQKEEAPVLKLVKQNYRLIHQNRRSRLYKRRE
jgi:hypothetical protein